MSTTSPNLLLANDDTDDCFCFWEALGELPVTAKLTTINDGIQFLQNLTAEETLLRDAFFLDLNMPRKSRFQCLSEIKIINKLMNLTVIRYSTSLNMEVVDLLYQKGAQYYICKPGKYDKLKNVILEAITLILQKKITQSVRDKFILQA